MIVDPSMVISLGSSSMLAATRIPPPLTVAALELTVTAARETRPVVLAMPPPLIAELPLTLEDPIAGKPAVAGPRGPVVWCRTTEGEAVPVRPVVHGTGH